MVFKRLESAVVAVAAATLLLAIAGCSGKSEADLVGSAKSYLAKNDTKAAILELKSLLQKNPQSAEARFLLGEALLKGGDAASAVVELEKANDLKYGDDAVLPLLARALRQTGQSKKVTDLYSRVVLSDAKAAASLKATVAEAYAGQGQLERSEAALNASLQFDPKNMPARLLQARLMAGTGALDEAMAMVDAILADDPKRVEALNHRGQILWFGKGDYDGAVKAFSQALEVDAKSMAAHMTLIGMALQKQDVPEFKSRAAALAKAMPGHPETRFYEAQSALIDLNYPRARELTQQLLKIAPDSPRLLQLAGAIEYQAGSPVLAETHLNKALQQAPNLVPARRLLAETHLRTGQPTKALATLKPLLERQRPDAQALAIAAEAYLQAGDLQKAEATFNEAAKRDPDNTKVKLALALSQIAKGQSVEGLSALESLSKTDTGVFADLALISVRMRRNELDAALSAVKRLQPKMAGKPLPDQLRGRILTQRKDWAGARASFEQALVVDPVYFPAVAGLAALDMAQQHPDDAVKRFESLLQRDPKNYRALMAVADLRQRSGAKPQEITALLTEAVTSNPGEVAPRLLLINHLLAQRDAKGAREAAQAAVAAVPDDQQLLDAQGRALLAAGDLEQAISVFRKLSAAQPNSAMPLLNMAEAYRLSKDYGAAAQSLRRALELAPDLMPAYRGLVQLAMADKRVDEALATARKAQKQRPKDPEPYRLEADVQYSQKRWDAAIAATRQALALSKLPLDAIHLHGLYLAAGRKGDADRFVLEWEREQPKDADFQVHLATLALTRSEFAASESRFRKALALRPDDGPTLNNLAWLLVQQGKPGAVALAERANVAMPNSTAVMDTLALALAADNQLAKAIEWQRRAVEAAPDGPHLRLNLARLLVKSGDKAGARVELERLAKLGSKFNRQTEVAALMGTLE